MKKKKNYTKKPTIFISMPIGTKYDKIDNDYIEIDFDEVLKKLIHLSIPLDYNAFRVDEIRKSSNIIDDLKIYLIESDVCIFDLTFSNPNVLMEYGIRIQAKPIETVVLIAQKNSKIPYNLIPYRVLFYDFFDESSWQEFNKKLSQFIISIEIKDYSFQVEKAIDGEIEVLDENRIMLMLNRTDNISQLIGLWNYLKKFDKLYTDPLLKIGKKFIEAGKNSEALEVLHRAYEEAPKEYEVARTYGWYLRRNNNFDLAEKYLECAIELNPYDVETLGMLGGLHKRKEDYTKALEYYKRAYELNSDEDYILLNLGLLFELNNKNKKANNSYYKRILEKSFNPNSKRENNIWFHLARGESYLSEGNLKESIKEYKLAISSGVTESMLESSINNIEFLLIPERTRSHALELLSRILYPEINKDIENIKEILEQNKITDFDNRYLKKPSIIFHLSDLHFGYRDDNTSSHRFGNGFYKKQLSYYIIEEIKQVLSKSASINDVYLIISGDITNRGDSKEYIESSKFISSIKEEIKLNPDNIVIVPGNHDINWSLSKENKTKRFDNYITFIKNVYDDNLEKNLPRFKWNLKIDEPRPTPSDLLSIHYFEESNLFIAGINSCTYEDEEHHFGAIGRIQLEEISNQLKKINNNELIKIAVLHHHVFPMDYRVSESNNEILIDKTIVRDFSLVEEYLQKLEFDIILHGHKHIPSIRETILYKNDMKSKRMIISSSGSTGADEKLLPQQIGNHFQVIKLHNFKRRNDVEFITFEWKELEYTDIAEWKTTKKLTLKG